MTQCGNIAYFLEQTIKAECNAEEFYRSLAVRFGYVPELRDFWNQYALEESEHAEWIASFRVSLSPHKLAQMIELSWGEVWADPQYSAERLLAGIRTLNDAYEATQELEFAEANALFCLLVTHFHEYLRPHDFLHTQLNQHMNRLVTDFPLAYEVRAAREAVLAAEGVF
jgi:hypothetical protein